MPDLDRFLLCWFSCLFCLLNVGLLVSCYTGMNHLCLLYGVFVYISTLINSIMLFPRLP